MPRPHYERLTTERPNPRSRDLDRLSPAGIARLMNAEDRRAVAAVGRVAPAIAAAVDRIVTALRGGGRLFFVGAGTSGRLGLIEAAECPPTFGTPPALVQAIEEATGREARIDRRPVPPGDVERTYADVTRARELLGYAPRVGLQEGLRRFVAWYREAMLPADPARAR